jgi:hypothetical protein
VSARVLALAVLVGLAACHRPPARCGVRCIPNANDGACEACLKARCCAESYAWMNGSDVRGFKLVPCVDQNCAVECPRAPRAER